MERALLPMLIVPLAAELANARIEDAVRPQHVDEAQQERGDDDEGAEHDAEREAGRQDGSEQRLVECEQPHEAEIDCHHGCAQDESDEKSLSGQRGDTRRGFGSATDLCVHIAPLCQPRLRLCESSRGQSRWSFSRARCKRNYAFLQAAVRSSGTPSVKVTCMSGSCFMVFLRKERTARMRGANCRSL